MDKGRFAVPAAVTDWATALGVAALLLCTGLSGAHPGGQRELLGSVLLAAGGLALAARRRAPLVVLAVTGACAVGSLGAGVEALAVSYLIAVYGAVRAGHRTVTVAVSVGLVIVLHLTALVLRDGSPQEAVGQARNTLELAWLIAAFAAGEAVRQAERRADEAERTREETARRRADEERLRIARELHDSLTHQISVIKVQSEVAVHVARRRGEQVPTALLAIQEVGREASRELRATLEALRDDDTTPPRGLDHVPGLVEGFQVTGLEATLTIEGLPHTLPAAVSRTAYRIVQESLTNVTRHAAATTASVLIGYRPDALAIRVDDNGKATSRRAPTPGLGLLGMRERVTALGGRLHTGPRSAGGFTVQAELPHGRSAVIRVLLVDDQPLIRSGFRALLDLEDDIEVVAEAADGRACLALVRERLPDVVLIDIQMPVMDGIEATRRIAADPALAGVHVVVLTNYGMDEYVFDALRAGAAGFLVKDILPEDFLHAVRVAARGDALLAPAITRKLIDRYVTQPPTARLGSGPDGLTGREREAVALAAYGLSNDEIADRLVISPATAKTHINRAMAKLHARDRAQLVVLAYESGLVTPPAPAPGGPESGGVPHA